MKNPFAKRNTEVTYTEVDTESTLGPDGKPTQPGTKTTKTFVAPSKKAAQEELLRRSRGGDKEVVDPTAKKTRRKTD